VKQRKNTKMEAKKVSEWREPKQGPTEYDQFATTREKLNVSKTKEENGSPKISADDWFLFTMKRIIVDEQIVHRYFSLILFEILLFEIEKVWIR
jgi:hypothetical protein